MPLIDRRPETVLANRFDSLLIQSHSQMAHDPDVLRVTLRVDYELDRHRAFVVGLACFRCEVGLNCVHDLRRTYPAANAHHAAAKSAPGSRSGTCAMAYANAPAEPMAKSRSAAAALRCKHNLRRVRCAQVSGCVALGDRYLHRRFNGQLRILQLSQLRRQ